MGDKTEVREALFPAPFYVALKPAWFHKGLQSSICQCEDPDLCARQHSAGTKSRALLRGGQAEGTGQHYRDANLYRKKLPMLLVGKVNPGKGQGKARGANCHEAWTTEEK